MKYTLTVDHETWDDIEAKDLEEALAIARKQWPYGDIIEVSCDSNNGTLKLSWTLKPGRCNVHPNEFHNVGGCCSSCECDDVETGDN